MKLKHLPGTYSILKLNPTDSIPSSVLNSTFFSVTKTDEELSIVCESQVAPQSENVEGNWRLLKILGPLDFSLTGILSSIARPLAEEKISIFALSTFDTDYVMVKEDKVEMAIISLQKAGFEF